MVPVRNAARTKDKFVFPVLNKRYPECFIPAGMNHDLLAVCSDVHFIKRSTCYC